MGWLSVTHLIRRVLVVVTGCFSLVYLHWKKWKKWERKGFDSWNKCQLSSYSSSSTPVVHVSGTVMCSIVSITKCHGWLSSFFGGIQVWVLIDLIIEVLDLIIKPFDNQTRTEIQYQWFDYQVIWHDHLIRFTNRSFDKVYLFTCKPYQMIVSNDLLVNLIKWSCQMVYL